ncbi:glutamate synthase subunit beta [Marinicrinis sediminis]|uniref:Glutamate synthase subunit beta n=1 Tax=Marinicrinis sediminis TaxID=1652465 RepID=A0ABW5RBJ7_9BACL
MGHPYGFLDYEREKPCEVEPQQRIYSWNEFTLPLDEERMTQQGARCMDCGVPFCQIGQLSEMSIGCPLNNLIPEWNDLVYRKQWREALKRLHKTNNFPEFTGSVCPALCEGSCTLGYVDAAVTNKRMENAIVDKGFREGWIVPKPPAQRTGKKVAVVGSGPAGLACAAQLNQAGHQVTVYERADRIGGLLTYGIPNMKLDKKKVWRRVNMLIAEGIKFVTNTEIGKDIPADELERMFDAVVLCGGATRARELDVEGRALAGVYQAMDYLTDTTKSLLDSGLTDDNYISARDKDVIVIGGGDTGNDCVATAIRHGCRSVQQFEIMPRAGTSRLAGNPWPEYPRIHKVDYGQREAESLYGHDPRRYAISTKRFAGENGRVSDVHTIQVKWEPNEEGRMVPVEVPGSEQVHPAQLVLIATGFTGPEAVLIEQLDLEQDQRSNVQAEFGTHMTSREGVFAAGDMRRGQSLVAWAIKEGRQAAREVDRYLMGFTHLP